MKLKRILLFFLVLAMALGCAAPALAAEDAGLMEIHTLTLSASPAFGGTVQGEGEYESGDVAAISAKAAEGYIFAGWRDETGIIVSYASPFAFRVSRDIHLEAVFEERVGFVLKTRVIPASGGAADGAGQYRSGDTAVVTARSARGYEFVCWQDETGAEISRENPFALQISRDMELSAVFRNTEALSFTLTYDPGAAGEAVTERHEAGENVHLALRPERQNYTFTGWYEDPLCSLRVTSIRMTGDVTVYAGWRAVTPKMLCGEDHTAYISGYPDGTIKPKNQITRAETAAVFYRLLRDEVRKASQTSANAFSDVGPEDWFNTEVSTLTRLGILRGYSDGTFRPRNPITRAEFAAIITRFSEVDSPEGRGFNDIAGHWAEAAILEAGEKAWITGYADGSFRPDRQITRAEAITIVNRMLGRVPAGPESFLAGMRTWPDNTPDMWYYLAIQEATNAHDWKPSPDLGEVWTGLK